MARNYGKDGKTAFQAKSDAQKIAFAPLMFQAAKALRDFNILAFLKKNKQGKRVEDIAKHAGISRYGARVLLEAGLSMELVYVKNDYYFITKTGFFISSDELTRVNMNFTHDVNYKAFFYLQEAVLNEKPVGLRKEFGNWPTIYEALADLPENVRQSWFDFDNYYSDESFPKVMPLVFRQNPRKILDIGGNTGKFAISCVNYDKNVQVTILDLPGQLREAFNNIKEKGFEEAIHGHPINILDFSVPYPSGFDVIWMSQFLDCFSENQIEKILANAKKALNNNGELFIMETFWDKQRFEASTYSLHATSLYFTCMANGNSRMYHSEDMIALVKGAGLKVEQIIENVGVSHTILRCKK